MEFKYRSAQHTKGQKQGNWVRGTETLKGKQKNVGDKSSAGPERTITLIKESEQKNRRKRVSAFVKRGAARRSTFHREKQRSCQQSRVRKNSKSKQKNEDVEKENRGGPKH